MLSQAVALVRSSPASPRTRTVALESPLSSSVLTHLLLAGVWELVANLTRRTPLRFVFNDAVHSALLELLKSCPLPAATRLYANYFEQHGNEADKAPILTAFGALLERIPAQDASLKRVFIQDVLLSTCCFLHSRASC